MKFKLFAIAAACLALASCSKDNGQEQQQPANASLKASPASLMFAAEETDAKTVTVTAENTEWNHSATADWLTIARDGNTLNITAAANTDAKMREATITISATAAGVADARVTVRQEGFVAQEPKFTLSQTELKFAPEDNADQVVTVTVEGGVEWTASAADEWVSLTLSDNTITVNVEDNPNSLARTSSITVRNTNTNLGTVVKAQYITVSQEPRQSDASITIVGLPEEGVIYTHYSNGYFERNFSGRLYVDIEPQWAEWTATAEGGSEWLSLSSGSGKNGDGVSIGPRDEAVYFTGPGEATITVTHSEDPNVQVSFKVYKTAVIDPNSESTISEDREMTATKAYASFTTFQDTYACGYSLVNLAFYTDDVDYDFGYFYDPQGKTPQHRYEGKGEIVQMTLYDIEDPNREEFSTGTYTIGEGTNAFTAAPGSAEMGERLKLLDCSYALIDNDVTTDVEFGLFTSGNVTIDKSGNNYTVTWEMYAGNGKCIKGSYNGTLDIKVTHKKDFSFGGGSEVPDDWGQI